MHPPKFPFCKVAEDNWKPGHIPKGRWAEESEGKGGEKGGGGKRQRSGSGGKGDSKRRNAK